MGVLKVYARALEKVSQPFKEIIVEYKSEVLIWIKVESS